MEKYGRVPDCAALLAQAEQQTGLNDLGDRWLLKNLEKLIPSLNAEARLSEAGAVGAAGMITTALSNRLRHVALVQANREILNEQIDVAAIVIGLPRTGSTMLHRMLASAPGMTGVRWFEAQNYAPFPGEERGQPEARREAAKQILDYMLQILPELMSIHPMSIDQADEEVIILGQLFSSTMIEATYFTPSYTAWLGQQSQRRAYADFYQILQAMQWQSPERQGASWVLKTPGHLMALDTVLATFPNAKIVMTHRDPVATVPSYCSMEESLYRLGSDEIDAKTVGKYWSERLADLLNQFLEIRANAPEDRFIDVSYRAVMENPIQQGEMILEAAGIKSSRSLKDKMSDWVEANQREDRATHKYSLDGFGLTKADIREKFGAYLAAFSDVL